MSVVVIGDIHFDDSRPWSVKVAQEVIKYIVDNPLNSPDNTLVFLGDLTERSSISGMVYSMLMSMFVGLKYKEVIILVGNHDGKLNQYNKPVLVYDFIRSKALKERLFHNFIIIDEPTELTLEGMDFLFLPHIFNDGKKSLKDYEKLHKLGINIEKKYTSVFGHFTNTFLTVPGEKIDVSYIKSDYWCFGHIHNPTEHYQGSIIPNSISEANQKRQVRVYSNGKERIDIAPNILDYYTVKFPEPLPTVEAKIPPTYPHNCKDEEVAQDMYPGIYIRRTIYDISMDNDQFDKLSKSLNGESEDVSIEDMLEEFLLSTKLTDDLKDKARLYLKMDLVKGV